MTIFSSLLKYKILDKMKVVDEFDVSITLIYLYSCLV